MNPKCAKCSKTVYPVEKLNLLDKAWHRGCFKCTSCSLTLNVKNYKGYDKMPYCHAHYPTTKFTAVADTPENLRIKKNTTQQSSVNYTKDFRDQQGSKTSVAEDPETARIKRNTQQQSSAQYHNLAEQRNIENQRRDMEAESLAGTYRQDEQPRAKQPLPELPPEPSYQPEPVGQPQPPRNVGSLYDQDVEPAAPPPPPQMGGGKGANYQAIYDYVAAAEDEVTFNEGDIIVNGEVIDEGWMTGTVKRTGRSGMLPSNYVEPV